jgi:hypothetical protein
MPKLRMCAIVLLRLLAASTVTPLHYVRNGFNYIETAKIYIEIVVSYILHFLEFFIPKLTITNSLICRFV